MGRGIAIFVLGLVGALTHTAERSEESLDKTGPDSAVFPKGLIGYTEFQTNLPGGRHGNVTTMRAMMVKADGTERHVLAEQLTNEPNTWTQFASWSPDGRTVVIGRVPYGVLPLPLISGRR